MRVFDRINKCRFLRDVIPGDEITETGLKCLGILNNRATVVGKLYKIENTLFISSKTNKYVPRVNDIVIGRIFNNNGDYYRVNISYGNLHVPMYTGVLPVLAFPNATKRNKPELNNNDLVMAIVKESKGDEVLLSCNGNGLGRIPYAYPVELWRTRILYFLPLYREISRYYRPQEKYKIGLSMNGWIYIDSGEYLEIKDALNKITDEIGGMQ